jgi:uncharacterized membrane protein YccC
MLEPIPLREAEISPPRSGLKSDRHPLLQAFRPIPGALFGELRALTLRGPRGREGLKAILSVLLAVAVAAALRLDDLSWAAFSGYMVMRPGFTEAWPRGMMRIAGTIGGAAFGFLAAPLVADRPILLMLALFVASWIGTFRALLSQQSYAWLFFGMTAGMIMTEALAAPSMIVFFAGNRIAEVAVGTGASLLVAALFDSPAGAKKPTITGVAGGAVQSLRIIWRERWWEEHWPVLVYSTRAALAVAALPLIWRWLEIEDFGQTAVTSYYVLIVPVAEVRERRENAIYARVAHRILGCLLGSLAAILCLSVASDAVLPGILAIAGGIWIGHQIQTGREGISYLGTQFALGFLITLIQGPAPASSILPGLERLLGIVIGSAMSVLVVFLWPLSDNGPRSSAGGAV